MKRNSLWKLTSLTLVAIVTGCAPKVTMEDIKSMRPERPVELDQLNMFVGSWKSQGTGEFMGMDELVTVSGTSTVEWAGDKWYLVEKSEFTMEDMDPMKAEVLYVYDQNRNKFRTYYADSMGGVGTGTLKYNERKNMWKMRVKGSSPMGSMKGVGKVRFLDENRMEWSWEEYPRWDLFGLLEIVEMEGTSQRN